MESVVGLLFPPDNERVSEIRGVALAAAAGASLDDRESFLTELTTAISQPEIPSQVEDVRVMSLHKSKGLSSPVTIIAGCVEGLLPKQPEEDTAEAIAAAMLEEQRRLFFVGVSRTKALVAEGKPGILVLSYSQRMPLASALGAGISPAKVVFGTAHLLASRFLGELGPSAPNPVAG